MFYVYKQNAIHAFQSLLLLLSVPYIRVYEREYRTTLPQTVSYSYIYNITIMSSDIEGLSYGTDWWPPKCRRLYKKDKASIWNIHTIYMWQCISIQRINDMNNNKHGGYGFFLTLILRWNFYTVYYRYSYIGHGSFFQFSYEGFWFWLWWCIYTLFIWCEEVNILGNSVKILFIHTKCRYFESHQIFVERGKTKMLKILPNIIIIVY